MGEVLVFDFMDGDEIMSHVEADFKNQVVHCIDYVDRPEFTVFGKNPHTIDELNEFFEDRCFSKHRPDLDILLGLIGLKQYNPLDIVRKTHGREWGDDFWIRFEDEKDLTYAELQERGRKWSKGLIQV